MAERTLLVVEDDAALRDTMMYTLRREGYRVLVASDGVTALEVARQQPPSLVVLDLMLPRLDGLDVCRQLRSRPETAHTPILMLTARGEESDVVVGLEMGADDYVIKPFSWNELRARIRALLRRGEQPPTSAGDGAKPDQSGAHILMAGDIRIDEERREVSKRGQPIELQARLFDLLTYMVRNRGTVLTRGRLLQHVWGYEYDGDNRTVDVYVRWLREKLEDDPASPQLILTVRGVGYRFKG